MINLIDTKSKENLSKDEVDVILLHIMINRQSITSIDQKIFYVHDEIS